MPNFIKRPINLNQKFFSGLLAGLGAGLGIALVSFGIYFVLAVAPGTFNPPGPPGPATDVSWAPLTVDQTTNRVGINDTTPGQALDVSGQIHATQDICTDAGGGKCLSSGGGSSLWTQSGADIYYNTGNVGVGIMNPGVYDSRQSMLDVNGYLAVNDVWVKNINKWASQAFTATVPLGAMDKNGDFTSFPAANTWYTVTPWTENVNPPYPPEPNYATVTSLLELKLRGNSPPLENFGNGLYSIEWGGDIEISTASAGAKTLYVRLQTRNPDVTTTWTTLDTESVVTDDPSGTPVIETVDKIVTLNLSSRNRQQFRIIAKRSGGAPIVKGNFYLRVERVFGY